MYNFVVLRDDDLSNKLAPTEVGNKEAQLFGLISASQTGFIPSQQKQRSGFLGLPEVPLTAQQISPWLKRFEK